MKNNHLLIATASLLLVVGCNATKHIADGEHLFEEATVNIQNDTLDKDRKELFESRLQSFVRPEPTSKLKVALWNMGGGPDTTVGFIKRFIKRQGKAPVLLSEVNYEYNENLLRNRLENLGFFQAQVTSDTLIDGKKATVQFDAFPGPGYKIREVSYEVDSTKQWGQDMASTKDATLLRRGNNYNLDVVINERERIDVAMKNKGYYYFNADNMLLDVDSTVGQHQVDMFMTVKPETAERAKQPQRIGKIVVFPDYRQTADGYTREIPPGTEAYQGEYYIYDPENKFRNKVLANHLFFHRGKTYNREDHNMTINHLVNMNTFQFVKNDFVDSPDSANTMDVYYYLTPMKPRALRTELIGKTATVYNGIEGSVNWSLKNAFKGFETLTLTTFAGFETQVGGAALNSNFIRYGAEAAISWPRLLSPYKWAPSRRYIPRTFASLRYEFLDRRAFYSLNSLTFNFGYSWKENERKVHDLTVAEIIYAQPRNVTEQYRNQAVTFPSLLHIIEPQFSFGPNYVYTFQNSMEDRTHTYFVRSALNTSGNVLGLIQGANASADNPDYLFGTRYAQFLRGEADFRHYWKITPKSTFVTRAMIGVSHSYGNSIQLPYLKQFFSGGPNGMRAFRARSVGPGLVNAADYVPDDFFADQTGDFKLELNAEYRAPISGIFNWAAFVDAGNIWLQRRDETRPGAELTNRFYEQLAVGGGLGLRVDIDFLVIRTDLAIPFRQPYVQSNSGWVFNQIDFGDREWRRRNLVFNLAIGYPF
ncbi:BamA/TamA family outer membrane protein [Sphingobacterium sp. lm-10]|uniref:translocation and assembly module lipoprotein TamL n=1 Tax=Sphingobacterium sp. lm-10 TaxID=2944904 RepID=UPI0020208E70|nr:BamA/TamA family outer membrane protein [Sphingobacterium sp. lm-10]MCL7987855.1 BamA/TamA family outer membrane protein [Sphingobacterium sp. lm-10]